MKDLERTAACRPRVRREVGAVTHHCLLISRKQVFPTIGFGPHRSVAKHGRTRTVLSPASLTCSKGVPGVLAAWDVRAGNVKRVASAAGEGRSFQAHDLLLEHLAAPK